MFKIVVLFFIIVWVLSIFLGKRRRVIRDVNHLLQLIFFAVLVFTSTSMLHPVTFFKDHPFYYAITVAALFVISWPLSAFIAKQLAKKR